MAEMLKGQNSLVLIRECYKEKDADKFLHLTEWELNIERDSDSEGTFEGTYSKGGSLESDLSGTAKMAKGDKTSRTVLDAVLDDTRYEVWVFDGATVNPEKETEFEAIYAQGYFNKFGLKAEVDEIMEYETEFSIEDKVKFGFAELPEGLKVLASTYGFHKPVAADPAKVQEVIPQPLGA